MQLLEGETLRELIASRSLDVATALALAIEVADAVDAADGKGIMHSDIKPANIFVTATLTDLGLSIKLTIETGFLYIAANCILSHSIKRIAWPALKPRKFADF